MGLEPVALEVSGQRRLPVRANRLAMQIFIDHAGPAEATGWRGSVSFRSLSERDIAGRDTTT